MATLRSLIVALVDELLDAFDAGEVDVELAEYFAALVAERQDRPGDDLLTKLIEARTTCTADHGTRRYSGSRVMNVGTAARDLLGGGPS